MSDREAFEKWAKDKYFAMNFSVLDNGEYDDDNIESMWIGYQQAVEHCKQGDILKNVKHEIGCDAIDMYSPDTDCTCGAEEKAKVLFAHAMPKSEPTA